MTIGFLGKKPAYKRTAGLGTGTSSAASAVASSTEGSTPGIQASDADDAVKRAPTIFTDSINTDSVTTQSPGGAGDALAPAVSVAVRTTSVFAEQRDTAEEADDALGAYRARSVFLGAQESILQDEKGQTMTEEEAASRSSSLMDDSGGAWEQADSVEDVAKRETSIVSDEPRLSESHIPDDAARRASSVMGDSARVSETTTSTADDTAVRSSSVMGKDSPLSEVTADASPDDAAIRAASVFGNDIMGKDSPLSEATADAAPDDTAMRAASVFGNDVMAKDSPLSEATADAAPDDSAMRAASVFGNDVRVSEAATAIDDDAAVRATSVFGLVSAHEAAAVEADDDVAVRATSVLGGDAIIMEASKAGEDDSATRATSLVPGEMSFAPGSMPISEDAAHKSESLVPGQQKSIFIPGDPGPLEEEPISSTAPLLEEETAASTAASRNLPPVAPITTADVAATTDYDVPAAPEVPEVPEVPSMASFLSVDSAKMESQTGTAMQSVLSVRPGLAPSSSMAMQDDASRVQSFIGAQDSYLESTAKVQPMQSTVGAFKEASFMGPATGFEAGSSVMRPKELSTSDTAFFGESPSGMMQRVVTETLVNEDATMKAHDASLLAQAVAAAPVLSAQRKSQANIVVLLYSMYGHVKAMSDAIVEGMESNANVSVSVFQVPETLDDEVLSKLPNAHKSDLPVFSLDSLDLLKEADGIVLGISTRFGAMPAQIKAVLDACYLLWRENGLLGKLATCFISTASLHGGQESSVLSTVHDLAHYGMMYVPLGPTPEMSSAVQPTGGSVFGAGTLAASNGSRMPSGEERAMARRQGSIFASKVQQFVCV